MSASVVVASHAAPTTPPCVLCGAADRDFVVRGYDRLFPRSDDYVYARCAHCQLVSLDPLPAEEDLSAFYPPDYYPQLDTHTRNLERPVNRLAIHCYYGTASVRQPAAVQAFFALLSPWILNGVMRPYGNNRLLDVGCGAGTVMSMYRRLGWTVRGIESSAHAAAAAKARGLDVHRGTVFDAPFEPAFDVVLLSHVIEHVIDPVAVLARVAEFAVPTGKIVVLTPNVGSWGFHTYGSCWYPLDAPRHLHLFDPATLGRLARAAGLVPARVVTRPSTTLLCHSHDHAVTQGATLPPDASTRAAIVRGTAHRPRYRAYRAAVSPLAWVAARRGRGELIEAELRPVGGTVRSASAASQQGGML